MSDQTQEKAEKYTSKRLDEILSRLSKDQLRFVVALQEYPSKKEAAESINIAPQTAYRWNGEIEEAARLMAQERLEAAKVMRQRALQKAIMVKIAGLDSDDEALRQRVATEIIEWELGKAMQRQELTGKDGKPLEVITPVGIDVSKL